MLTCLSTTCNGCLLIKYVVLCGVGDLVHPSVTHFSGFSYQVTSCVTDSVPKILTSFTLHVKPYCMSACSRCDSWWWLVQT